MPKFRQLGGDSDFTWRWLLNFWAHIRSLNRLLKSTNTTKARPHLSDRCKRCYVVNLFRFSGVHCSCNEPWGFKGRHFSKVRCPALPTKTVEVRQACRAWRAPVGKISPSSQLVLQHPTTKVEPICRDFPQQDQEDAWCVVRLNRLTL